MSLDEDRGPDTPREQNLVDVLSFEERMLLKLDAIIETQAHLQGELLAFRSESRTSFEALSETVSEVATVVMELDVRISDVEARQGSSAMRLQAVNGKGHGDRE